MEKSEKQLKLEKLADWIAEKIEGDSLEVVMTGSVARNQADEFSDLEVRIFKEGQVERNDMVSWLGVLGCTDYKIDDDPLEDRSLWCTGIIDGEVIEVGWQTYRDLEANIEEVMNARTLDHEMVMIPWIMLNAKALKSTGAFEKMVSNIRYAQALRQRLIKMSFSDWIYPNVVIARKALAYRDQRVTFWSRVIKDIEATYRLLFALNSSWEPDWKWSNNYVNELKRKPRDLVERVNQMFDMPPRKAVGKLYELIREVLVIGEGEGDFGRQIQNIDMAWGE